MEKAPSPKNQGPQDNKIDNNELNPTKKVAQCVFGHNENSSGGVRHTVGVFSPHTI
jgi:hypothetical protein